MQVFVLTKPLDTINFSDLLENMFNSHEVFFSGYICWEATFAYLHNINKINTSTINDPLVMIIKLIE